MQQSDEENSGSMEKNCEKIIIPIAEPFQYGEEFEIAETHGLCTEFNNRIEQSKPSIDQSSQIISFQETLEIEKETKKEITVPYENVIPTRQSEIILNQNNLTSRDETVVMQPFDIVPKKEEDEAFGSNNHFKTSEPNKEVKSSELGEHNELESGTDKSKMNPSLDEKSRYVIESSVCFVNRRVLTFNVIQK